MTTENEITGKWENLAPGVRVRYCQQGWGTVQPDGSVGFDNGRHLAKPYIRIENALGTPVDYLLSFTKEPAGRLEDLLAVQPMTGEGGPAIPMDFGNVSPPAGTRLHNLIRGWGTVQEDGTVKYDDGTSSVDKIVRVPAPPGSPVQFAAFIAPVIKATTPPYVAGPATLSPNPPEAGRRLHNSARGWGTVRADGIVEFDDGTLSTEPPVPVESWWDTPNGRLTKSEPQEEPGMPIRRSASTPPPRKPGWNHTEQVLVFYPALPEFGLTDKWGVAYYHYEPPFTQPCWVDFHNDREPSHWWPLPAMPKEGL